MSAIGRRSYAQPDIQPGSEPAAPLRAGEILPTPDFAQLRRGAQFFARVRPHRRGGVRLSLEPEIHAANGTKFLIHNYGHSGAGITLSFGCASVVGGHVQTIIDQMRGTRTRPVVAILGSGVIGLTVAAELRRKWPMLPITIYAKTRDVTATTSFIAGGQFAPSQIGSEYAASDRHVLDDYLRRSAARIREIENSGRQLQYGIVWRKDYTLAGGDPSFDMFTPRDVVPAFTPGRLPFRRLNEPGREYSTWLVNPRILLPKLMADLTRGGVRVEAKEFQDRQQVEGLRENIVINCTGYGAKKLFEDAAVVPRRGHLVGLRNPAQLKYFFSGGCKNNVIAYLFARQSDIVVGGTVRTDDRDYFDQSDSTDVATCNLLLDNIQNVFDGRPGACTTPMDVA
jgi:glycine/D-amino acid oxidase-like deaminating enzyme